MKLNSILHILILSDEIDLSLNKAQKLNNLYWMKALPRII